MVSLVSVAIVAAWFLHSLQFNLVMKRELVETADRSNKRASADATRATFFHLLWGTLLISTALVTLSWTAVRAELPRLRSRRWWLSITVPALLFMLGTLATNHALARMSIGLTHIIKTLEPLFTVVMTWLLLGTRPTSSKVGTLSLVVLGTALVVGNSLQVDVIGVAWAFAANLFLQARNVLGKAGSLGCDNGTGSGHGKGTRAGPGLPTATDKAAEAEGGDAPSQHDHAARPVHPGVLIAAWSAVACLGMLAIMGLEAVFLPHVAAGGGASLVEDGGQKWYFWPGLHFACYNLASIMVLSVLSAVMHATLNCSKRAFIWFGSALALGLSIAGMQVLGVIMALTGVFLTNHVERVAKAKAAPVPSPPSSACTSGAAVSSATKASGSPAGGAINHHVRTLLGIMLLAVAIGVGMTPSLPGSLTAMQGVHEAAAPNLAMRLEADLQKERDAAEQVLSASGLERLRGSSVHVVWAYSWDMPPAVVRRIEYVARQLPLLTVYCGTAICAKQAQAALRAAGCEPTSTGSPGCNVRRLNLLETCAGTALEAWVRDQWRAKVRALSSYDYDIQEAAVLCVLHAFGGAHLHPVLALDPAQLSAVQDKPWLILEPTHVRSHLLQACAVEEAIHSGRPLLAQPSWPTCVFRPSPLDAAGGFRAGSTLLSEVMHSMAAVYHRAPFPSKATTRGLELDMFELTRHAAALAVNGPAPKLVVLPPAAVQVASHRKGAYALDLHRLGLYGAHKYQGRIDEQAKNLNLGDEIQVLAAMQYLPRIDLFVERDHMRSEGAKLPFRVTMFTNAWYMGSPGSPEWPPPDTIDPVLVSMHVAVESGQFFSSASLRFLKDRQVFGVRDPHTQALFAAKGLRPFLGQMTLTLRNPFGVGAPRSGIVIVDVPARYLELVPSHVRDRATYLTHDDTLSRPQAMHSEGERLAWAVEYLEVYAKSALVLTSRLHVALPCAALGTPVIFFNTKVLVQEQTSKPNPRLLGLTRYSHMLEDYHSTMEEMGEILAGFNYNSPPANPNNDELSMTRARLEAYIEKWPVLRDAAERVGIWPRQ